MKYLVTVSEGSEEEKVLCENEQDAVDVIERKVLSGVDEGNINVYSVESVDYQVERVPVVKLGDSADEPVVDELDEVAETAVSNLIDLESNDDEVANPFVSEQVFSLDS